MIKRNFTLPLSKTDIESLHAGEVVTLSGILYTARDAAHKLLCNALQNEEELPFDLKTAAIFYAGPAPAKNGEIIGSCGPTTAQRMDDYTPLLLERGLRVMIGKGKRNHAVTEAIKKHGAVYFAAIGGAGALYQSYIKSAEIVAYAELGCEAVYKLTVKNFEVVTGIDCKGNSILK